MFEIMKEFKMALSLKRDLKEKSTGISILIAILVGAFMSFSLYMLFRYFNLLSISPFMLIIPYFLGGVCCSLALQFSLKNEFRDTPTLHHLIFSTAFSGAAGGVGGLLTWAYAAYLFFTLPPSPYERGVGIGFGLMSVVFSLVLLPLIGLLLASIGGFFTGVCSKLFRKR